MFLNNRIKTHYNKNWHNGSVIMHWPEGPINDLYDDFCILEFPPSEFRDMWTYATCGMSNLQEEEPIELHIFSSIQDESLVELLTIIAYYHKNTSNLGLWHSVNFGRPWQGESICTYGLVSLPYLDGPDLENMYIPEVDNNLKFLWLIPITEDEAGYKDKYGVEPLEEKFEEKQFNYIDSNRKSVLEKRRGLW